MKNTILMFVKIFEKESYREDFLSGKLFMNRLSYFRGIEGDDSANRADRFEAVKSWLQPDSIVLKVNDLEITGKDFAAPVMIQMDHHKNYNLYCLYAGHTGEFDEINADNAESIIEGMRLDESCLKLGDLAVVIHNPKEFMERVSRAIRENGHSGGANLVEYYSPEVYHGHFEDKDVILRKREEYSHQREYRIFVDTNTEGDDPLVLYLGGIRDIASPVKTSEINQNISATRRMHN